MEQLDYEVWPGPDYTPREILFRRLMEGACDAFKESGQRAGKTMASFHSVAVGVDLTEDARVYVVGARIGSHMHLVIEKMRDAFDDIKPFLAPETDPTKKQHGPRRGDSFSKGGPKRISAPDSVRGCGIMADRIGWHHGRR